MLDLIFFHEISFPFMGSLLKVKTLNALKGLISEIGKAGGRLLSQCWPCLSLFQLFGCLEERYESIA